MARLRWRHFLNEAYVGICGRGPTMNMALEEADPALAVAAGCNFRKGRANAASFANP